MYIYDVAEKAVIRCIQGIWSDRIQFKMPPGEHFKPAGEYKEGICILIGENATYYVYVPFHICGGDLKEAPIFH